MIRVAVRCPAGGPHPGRELARELGIPVCAAPEPEDCDLVLEYDARGRLGIRAAGERSGRAVVVDFDALRPRTTGAHHTPLARAVLGRRRTPRFVLDANAGLGRDTFTLAALGCRVLAVERHPVVWALLADGLRRALAHEDLEPSARRIELRRAEAAAVLDELAVPCDVVLLDPMVGPAGRSARPKKDLQILARLLGGASQEAEAADLLERARGRARRIVVKRPRRAAPIAPGRCATAGAGRVRFDVYAGRIGTAPP